MLAPGAAKGYRQVALSFLDVARQQEEQQLGDPVEKFGGLGEFADVFCHLGMAPGQVAELRHEMRIGQEPYVENQVRLQGYPVLVTEADRGHQQVLVRAATLELLQNVGA